MGLKPLFRVANAWMQKVGSWVILLNISPALTRCPSLEIDKINDEMQA